MPASGPTATLLIRCPDQRGLVARSAQFVADRNGNLVHAEHHIDPATGLFLMRLEWQLDGFALDRDAIRAAFEPLADEIDAVWSLHFSDVRPTIAIWATREDHCLGDLLLRHRAGELFCDVAFVLANHGDLESLATSFAIPFHYVPVDPDYRERAEHNQLALLNEHSVDLVVLAKYMQILSPNLIASFEQLNAAQAHDEPHRLPDRHRIINIHHSFLPAFVGANPYERAFERGVKIIGATAHYVTGELDAGPIIEQDTIRASHRDSVDDLIRKGRDVERVVLARAVRNHLANRVLVHGNRTSVFD